MTKILQIAKYYYPFVGGTEQVTRDIVLSLNGQFQYQQKIICFNEDACNEGFVSHRNETVTDLVDGSEVIRCKCITKIASQSISLVFSKKLEEVMDNFQPEIVIIHFPNPFATAFFEKYFNKNFKLIVYWHLDITKQKILKKLFHPQTIRLLNRADRIVATSPIYIDGSPYLSRYREKCVVVPNCINESRLQQTDVTKAKAAMIRKENDGKIICFAVGRHIPYKGLTWLVQASKYLDDRFRIYIGGQGPLTEQLKKEAEGDEKITFLGRVSDDDLIAWYSAMDIFCFPSITKNEAFGIALAEAMYFAKPAVTFTIPGSGVNYVSLNRITGIECPNADPHAFAEAMISLAEDKALRVEYGQNARQRVQNNFMYGSFRKNFLCLLFSVSNNKRLNSNNH